MCYLHANENKTGTIMQRIAVRGAYVVLLLALCGGNAGASENTCKGLTETPCRAENGCSWVRPGKTATGKPRAGYCRRKPSRKKTTEKVGGSASAEKAMDKK